MRTRFILYCALLVSAASASIVLAAPGPAIWIDVPFVAQPKEGCGSASISMVMRYWERKTGQETPIAFELQTIQTALYSPEQGGIPASSMRKFFIDAGYRAFAFQGEWQDLRHDLELGRPLIVCLRASGPLGPLHYVVVVGIDFEKGYVFVHDPAQHEMLRISRDGFESEWHPTHNWTLLAVPQSGD